MLSTLILFSFFTFHFSFATVFNVPADYPTIQEAIDAANPGDEVLVDDGTYYENILIEKNIYLNSVNGAEFTIIDGSQSRSQGSVMVIRPDNGAASPPIVEVRGFAMVNGSGTLMQKEIDTPNGPQVITEKAGGGLLVYKTSPKVNNCKFLDNGSNDTDKGGAVYATDSEDIGFYDLPLRDGDFYALHPDFKNSSEHLDFSNNTFLGNDANQGHSVYIEGYVGTTTDLTEGYFDVYADSLGGSSEYWIKGIGSEFNETDGDGEIDAIIGDVYVSPNGNDSLNTGLSWESPFQTINFALSQVYADSLNPATIHLAEGIYSPSISGEKFPIIMLSNIDLIGQGKELTYLDAKQSGGVIYIVNIYNTGLKNITVKNGMNFDYGGGGIFLQNSNPDLLNIIISDNEAGNSGGGGIAMLSSNPTISNVVISENYASYGGGGIWCKNNSNPILTDVIIEDNSSPHAGGILIDNSSPIFKRVSIKENFTTHYYGRGSGIYCHSNSFPKFEHTEIIFNQANFTGGGFYCNRCSPILQNVSISDNTSQEGGGLYLDYSTPIVLNSIIWNNSPEYIIIDQNWYPPYFILSFSNIQGGLEGIISNENDVIYWGQGNINTDPLFTNTDIGDYTLQDDSPCIDAGADFFVWEGDTLIDLSPDEYYGSAPDMGAYEWTPEETEYELGDLTGDGLINVLDVVALVNIVLTGGDFNIAGDLNSDEVINILDVVMLVEMILGGRY